MTAQDDLPLPPAPAGHALSLDALRGLVAQCGEALAERPQLAGPLAVLNTGAPGQQLAALRALYGVAGADDRRLIRTARALAQMLLDAEAHAARQPGARLRAAAPAPAIVATDAARPLSLFRDAEESIDLNPS